MEVESAIKVDVYAAHRFLQIQICNCKVVKSGFRIRVELQTVVSNNALDT